LKIAVESNDGINIASPNNLLKNFMIFEVNEKMDKKSFRATEFKTDSKSKLKLIKSIGKTKNMMKELGDCSSVISHGFNRSLLNELRKAGVDVYITFQNRIYDAIERYLQDYIIHKFH
jgi:hypothetical protein